MHVDEEKWDSSLLEKYVLGLCDMSEKREVERLIEKHPELARKIKEMQKAVRCYCTSCHSDKVKSILRGKENAKNGRSVDEDARMVSIKEDNQAAPGAFQKVTSFLRNWLPFSGW